MIATMNASTFIGKNFMDNENSIKNSTDLILKKMIDISEKLVSEQEEINNVNNLLEKSFMEQLSLMMMKLYQSSTHKSLRFLRFCAVLWKGPSTSRIQRSLEEKD